MLKNTPSVAVHLTELALLGRSRSTLMNTEYNLLAVERAVDATHGSGRDLLTLTRAEVLAIYPYLRGRYTPSQYRQVVASLAGHLKWSVATGLLERSPMASIPLPPQPRTMKRGLTANESLALVGAMETGTRWLARDRVILSLLLTSGLRGCEVRTAEMSRITNSPEDGAPGITVTGKAGHERWVPMTSTTQAALAAYLPEREARLKHFGHAVDSTDRLIVAARPGYSKAVEDPTRMELSTPVYVSHLLRPWLRAINVDGIGSHATRRAFATMGCQDGGPFSEFLMAAALGHADHALLARYRAVSHRELANACERHPLNRLLAPLLTPTTREAAA